MQEITPAYYATGAPTGSYVLIGSNFSEIPTNAIGIWAGENNNPLEWKDYNTPNLMFDISVVDDGRLNATPQNSISHTKDGYLGAIVSADRNTIYWVNDTKPLP